MRCAIIRAKAHQGLVSKNFPYIYRSYASQSKHEEVIFSGIQPTGVPHLGNYFGALSQWVDMQNAPGPKRQLLYSVVGLHALTMPQDPKKLYEDRINTLASILAVGVDPNKAILFFQEDVPQHAELGWILNCYSMMGRLRRMTTWKSKLAVHEGTQTKDIVDDSNLNLGLFTYPVLQAADVLLYRTTQVPVGEDQRQHLELARELAQKMNRVMNTDFFPLPTPIINPAKRILSLKGPSPQKMSKSAPNPHSRILITDSTAEIQEKLKSSYTDSIDPESLPEDHVPTLDELSPSVGNLYTILSCCTGEEVSTLIPQYYRRRYGYLKTDVAAAVDAKLAPIRKEYERLRKPDGEAWLREVAMMGRERASAIAVQNLTEIKKHLGIAAL